MPCCFQEQSCVKVTENKYQAQDYNGNRCKCMCFLDLKHNGTSLIRDQSTFTRRGGACPIRGGLAFLCSTKDRAKRDNGYFGERGQEKLCK